VLLFNSYTFRKHRASERYTKAIVRCFNKDDSAGLRALFCDDILSKYDPLDEEILTGLDLVKGKIISYDRAGIGGETLKTAGRVDLGYVIPWLDNVVTDTGDMYFISYGFYFVNDKMPDTIGLTAIEILDKDHKKLLSIGTGLY
jgi:hypothetical protein